jgi:hypothetical protein
VTSSRRRDLHLTVRRKQLFTDKQSAADLVGLHPKTIERLIRRGCLPAFKLAGKVRTRLGASRTRSCGPSVAGAASCSRRTPFYSPLFPLCARCAAYSGGFTRTCGKLRSRGGGAFMVRLTARLDVRIDRSLRRLRADAELVRRRAAGASFRSLAADYGVAHTTLSRYLARNESPPSVATCSASHGAVRNPARKGERCGPGRPCRLSTRSRQLLTATRGIAGSYTRRGASSMTTS